MVIVKGYPSQQCSPEREDLSPPERIIIAVINSVKGIKRGAD